jgi:hypothetical protein
MITGTTRSGFEYEVPDTVGDDYEVLEALTRLQKENDLFSIVTLIDHVLGAEQRDAFKEHCKTEDGRVSTEMMMNEFLDIFSGQKDLKK